MLLQIHGFSRWCYLHGVPCLPRLLKAWIYLVFRCVVPPECSIGAGTRFWHSGLGIVLHPDVTIGKNCNIYNHVVIGGGHDGPDGPAIRIVVGDSVTIGAGAKIMCKSGLLLIGDGSSIGANAVVLSDVPPHTIAVGVPAQLYPKKSRRDGSTSLAEEERRNARKRVTG